MVMKMKILEMSNTRNELFDILEEMIEHTSIGIIFSELCQAMTTDELHANVKHLDQHLFENHFLTRED